MPGCSPSTPHTMWKHWKNCGYESSTLYLGSREGLGICTVPPEVKGAMSPYVTLFVTFIFLLFKTISRHWNCFLSSVVKNGKDGHGVQLVKVGVLMLRLHKSPKNIMVWHPLHNPTGAFCEWVKTLKVMISAQNWPNIHLKQQYHRDIAPFTSPIPMSCIFVKRRNRLRIKLNDVITVIQVLWHDFRADMLF